MKTISKLLASCILLLSFAAASPVKAEGEKRIAFVVGNAAYPSGPLATAANDAGLIAQTLQAAGFDVAGARDLDGEGLRAAFHDFLDKAQASGPDTVAFVYLNGYGLQLDGENYFVPLDAKIASASDVAVEAVRVSDYTKRLSGLPLKATFIVLDAARESPFAGSGQNLAGGLALAEADPNMLIAFNAAPGTVAPGENGPYGAYAQALAEMIREGGLAPSQVFDAVRLRVNEVTKGAEVPWSESRITAPFAFFERAADAPPPSLKTSEIEAMRSRPLRDLGARDAYAAAIERDSLQGYEEFVADYPSDPLAKRVRALLAARREAIVWRRTRIVNTPDAFWSYLNRYPRGPHAADARYRLEALSAPVEPPASFAPIVYDVPPPPPAEVVYVDRPVLVLSDPSFGFVPPPPIAFLAPPPPYLVFAPPPPPIGLFVLPIPLFVPVPAFINPPPYVVAPPNNVYFANIHNTTVINNINNTIVNQGAGVAGAPATPVAGVPGAPAAGGVSGATTAAGIAAGAAAGAIAAKVALPPSLARKSELMGQGLRGNGAAPAATGAPPAVPGAPSAQKPLPGAPGAAQTLAPHTLPGMDGKPLPGQGGKQGTLPSGPGALPGATGKPLPGQGEKQGTLPSGPGALPGAIGKPLPGQGEKQGTLPGGPGALPGAIGKPLPGQGGKQGTLPGGPGALPGPTGKPLPGQGEKQGTLPGGPGALPGATGKPLPGQGEKQGTLPGGPGALPGAIGKPLPGQGGKQGTLPGGPGALPGATGMPVPGTGRKQGTTSLGEPGPSPGGQGTKGSVPGRITPPGGSPPKQTLDKLPKGPARQPSGFGPQGAGGNPAFGGPRPATPPPQQYQQKRPPPQTYLPARPPPQAQQWHPPQAQQQWHRPPQAQQWHPPPQAQQWHPPPQAQQWHPPPQAQQWHPPAQAQQWHPPPQAQQGHPPPQQRSCGTPGQPPCR